MNRKGEKVVTTDRTGDLWGDRTPYGQGETWPVRVDQFLEEGIAEEEIDAWVQSAAVLHSNGDGIDIAVKGGRIAGIRGRAGDHINHGRVDPKDLLGWQANNPAERLTRPLLRRDGRLEPACASRHRARGAAHGHRLDTQPDVPRALPVWSRR